MAAVLRFLLAAMLLPGGVPAASAQAYPNRPVRVVVGFPAGGNIASGQVAHATPDGYTIMAISTGFVVNPSLYAKVPYDPVKDFAAVTLVAVSPNVVVVNPQVPAQ